MLHPTNFVISPSGGYIWKDATLTSPIVENSPTVFLSKVYNRLVATGGFVGTGWEDKVWEQTCLNNPAMACREKGKPERHTTWQDVEQFGHTVSRFVEGGGVPVPQEEAERRATICASCPKNKPLTGVCASCGKFAAWLLGIAVKWETTRDNDLFACGVCGCHLRLSVHVPLEAQQDERFNAEDFPLSCWKRQCAGPNQQEQAS